MSLCAFVISVRLCSSVREKGEHERESGPSPNPSPEGKGRDHRDTPIMRVYASFYPLISSPIGVTSHTTPLPEGA